MCSAEIPHFLNGFDASGFGKALLSLRAIDNRVDGGFRFAMLLFFVVVLFCFWVHTDLAMITIFCAFWLTKIDMTQTCLDNYIVIWRSMVWRLPTNSITPPPPPPPKKKKKESKE